MSHARSQRRRARWQRFKRAAIATSATAATFLPAAAHAEEGSFGGGVFVGYRFGSGSHFEWGLEAFGTGLFKQPVCSNDERSGVGGFAQIAWLGLESPRLTLGAHAGGELNRNTTALTGELGASYRFGPEGGFGIHTGVMAEALYFNAAARYQWLLNEALLSGGIRVFATYGPASRCEVGRPLRTDAGLLALHARSDAPSHDPGRRSDAARIESVGRGFERDAQLECASIPAFLQLAAELAFADAPPALVTRALHAARDEARHTELCAALARRHLLDVAAPALPDVAQRQPLAGNAGRARLAIESWIDGCISEGRAAAHALRAAQLATDVEAQRVQRAIAADEQRHAELAWSILDWSLARGGDEVHEAVHALRDIDTDTAVAAPEFAQEGLQTHGRLGAKAGQAIAARHAELSRTRLEHVLSKA